MKPHIGMNVRTGDKCPKSGVWKVLGTFETVTTAISRGNKMPQHANKSVTWRLVFCKK